MVAKQQPISFLFVIENSLQAMPGVEGFIGVNDIPGNNSLPAYTAPMGGEIFSSGRIDYAGQPLGLILADSYEHARYMKQQP